MLRQATSTAYYVLIGYNTIREWKKLNIFIFLECSNRARIAIVTDAQANWPYAMHASDSLVDYTQSEEVAPYSSLACILKEISISRVLYSPRKA